MAILFVNNVEYSSGAQSQKLRLENIASDPSSGLYEGRVYYNTASDVVRLYTAAGWIDIGASYNFTAASNTGSSVISDGDTLTINGGTALTGSMSGDTITIDHDDIGTAGTYAYPSSVQTNAQGHVISITAGSAPATPSDATITLTAGSGLADGGAFTLNQASNETIQFNVGAGDGIQVNANDVAVDYAGTDNVILSAADGTGITLADGDDIIFSDATDNGVKFANLSQLKTYINASGSYSWTLSDGTNNQTINNTDTVTFAVGGGINAGLSVAVSATDDVTHLLKLEDVSTVTSIDPAADFLVGVDGTANEKILYQNVHLNQWGDAEGVVNMGSSGSENRIKHLQAGSDATDAVNVAQLNAAISGVGLFQGGYNANTGLTTDLSTNGSLDGASNIALDKGDFFVVTTAGSAFYSETLEVGDMIYANQDITASSNPAQSVYTVVIADENIAGAGTSDGATQKGVAGFNSAHFNVTANGWVSSDIYGGGSTLGIVPSGGASTTFLRGDGTWVTPTNTQRAAGTGLSLSGNTINANVDGTQSTAANASTTTASRTYNIQVDGSDNLVVNVPWTDTNTQTVTSVDEVAPGTSTGTPIVVDPTTGDVKVKSMAYDGGNNVGHVPSGGSSSTFLRGDGTWVTPADTGALGKRIVLNSALAYVSKADSGGIRTFAINVADSNVFGSGSTAINVKCEVIDASTSGATAGQTVYADVTRGVNAGGATYGTASLNIAFVGTPADSAYEVLLTYVG